MRGERQAGEHSLNMSPLRLACVETTECGHMQTKKKTPRLRISK